MNYKMGYILITGASSGLGLSHAIFLTAHGYNVIGTSRNANKINLNQLKASYIQDHKRYFYTNKEKTQISVKKTIIPSKIEDQLDSILSKIHFISLDVTNSESVTQGVKEIIAYCKENNSHLDILINNAGNSFFGSVEDLSIEQTIKQFDTNYFGYIRMIQEILPYFRNQQKGLIINTASVGGTLAIPFESHYSASKAAILKMSESLYNEVIPYNIHIVTISPGDINTNFNVNTINLHNKKNAALQSIEITEMLESNPVSANSPYFKNSQKTWMRIIQNLLISPSPSEVSKVILKIIKSSHPKMHYTAGSRTQRILNWLARRFVTDEFMLKGTASFFGLAD